MQKSRESELVFRMITAHALVQRMDSVDWVERPNTVLDTQTILGWLNVLLKMPEDGDLQAFCKKHAEAWLDAPEETEPVPVHYAYKRSRGER